MVPFPTKPARQKKNHIIAGVRYGKHTQKKITRKVMTTKKKLYIA